jgi:pimeloyl-ACP methyl ester carboxylesterase
MKAVVLLLLLLLWRVAPASSWFSAKPTTFLVSKPSSSTGRTSIPDNVRVLILPGFGNDARDYVVGPGAGTAGREGGSLVQSLRQRGWKDDQIRVMPLERWDWLSVFLNGLVDPTFWQGQMPPTRPSFNWYLQRVAEQVQDLCATTGEKNREDIKVVLLCHSAGGWLARAALGFRTLSTAAGEASTDDDDDESVSIDLESVLGMVTLGAPHLPPPPEIMDMTRGALRITNERFPGAYHKPDGLFYITVIGNAIAGAKDVKRSLFQRRSLAGFAFDSYEVVCGDGTTVGDGVVPISAAHLEDAIQVELEGVFHSVNVPVGSQW